MDETDKNKQDRQEREEIYANAVRAGKRTYFFDVRATRGNDYYLTITESKKRFNDDGTFRYQKHKIFLYKEDFEKFADALSDTIQKIIELNQEQSDNLSENISNKFTDVSFDELGNGKGQAEDVKAAEKDTSSDNTEEVSDSEENKD